MRIHVHPVLYAVVLPLFALLIFAFLPGCHRQSELMAVRNTRTSDGYVGNDACLPCHTSESALHAHSRHALAMRAATSSGLGAMTPPAGPVPMAGYVLEHQGDKLVLTRSIVPKGPVTLDLALGSGKVGITFVSLPATDKLLEAHMSYFPAGKQWDYTPGHEIRQSDDSAFGRTQQPPDARRCLGCHSVTLPANDLRPEPRFYGVGCEACHGPGQKHVQLMQTHIVQASAIPREGDKSDGDNGMVALQKLSSQQVNDLCGKCHRALKDVDLESLAAAQTHRFQAYAMTRSRCRNADGSVLSCLTCHTPHDNVSTDIPRYEQICLKCHLSTSRHPLDSQPNRQKNAGKPCPVNSKDGCIRCHMRERQSFPGLYWKPMVDHYISVGNATEKIPGSTVP